ncbi:TonB-dependent receptor [Niveispirillum sp.]|uniref:TonB-dependent receptor n=1 Tax=Niveispirillum sp. TaxID=1917217 RepID=UPI001B61B98D|nr:TonB-dependent receptor [Niveispirillum sp.]MBP7335492.1 TonB-dependent receptor [Niveispirillum sp.]
MKRSIVLLSTMTSLTALVGSVFAQAPGADNAAETLQAGGYEELQEIIVTAQKRSDRLRDVPLSITAATGEQLKAAGITSTGDLEKLVPGFTAINTAFGNPVFFIRGIGFNDTTLGVSPAVSIYMDQQPFSFSPMARGAVLDLERLEVLKGPQGTLFGQNSTGGAVNYIAAKPKSNSDAGFEFTYGRFGQADAEGFVNTPVSDTLSVRVAARSENRNEWQKNYITDERLGNKRFLSGRLSALWTPIDTVSVLLTANGWRDRSDAQQPQFIAYTPARTGATARPVPFPMSTFPAAPRDARATAFPNGFDYQLDNWFSQFSANMDADLSDAVHVASLTTYGRFGQSVPINYGGTSFANAFSIDDGEISTFAQELRLNGDVAGTLNWMVGANYKWDHVIETQYASPLITTSALVGRIPFDSYDTYNNQKITSKSVFGSLDYVINDQLTAQGSVRYNKEDRDYTGCIRDSGDGTLAAGISALVRRTLAPGSCVSVASDLTVPPIVENSLVEDNVSYRLGLNWKPETDALIYANVTKGYKSGSFPSLPGIFVASQDPIGQESVLAFEAGAKVKVARKLDITGAAFYYDYRDKQLLGAKADPTFVILPALVSIPKSNVKGAELSLTAGPFSGLTFTLSGTHVMTRVDRNPVNPAGPYGEPGDFVGQAFPFTPKWQGSANADYRFPVSSTFTGFAGLSATGRTKTTASLLSHAPAAAVNEALMTVPGYVLVDLRAGIETDDERWRFEIWGRNVFDKYYVTGTKKVGDFTSSFTGAPATYGITLRYSM